MTTTSPPPMSGAWIQPAYGEWFSLRDLESKWVVLRHSRHCPNKLGGVSQTITLDGIDYEHLPGCV